MCIFQPMIAAVPAAATAQQQPIHKLVLFITSLPDTHTFPVMYKLSEFQYSTRLKPRPNKIILRNKGFAQIIPVTTELETMRTALMAALCGK
ncbi:protein of unknown function [Paenibacillus alvei]|uniref:Uncharacterized protein n=1 Tax=Paenibacillus alvei TaxID=44250 RepID=A0A383R6P7_PAEAL|nr:protein of unknown function [Paenibacillus alvei]